jgi:hypothetical protein
MDEETLSGNEKILFELTEQEYCEFANMMQWAEDKDRFKSIKTPVNIFFTKILV